MSAHRIIQRYAKSLIDLASEQKVLDEVINDVNLILDSFNDRDLYLMVKSPIVKPTSKRNVFSALYEKRVNKITFAFIDILVRKGREQMLPEILKGAIEQYMEVKGITAMTLITTVQPDDELISRVKSAIESIPSINQVEIKSKVDPDLIGGMVLDFGDKRIDASVRHELNLLRKKFATASISA
ncbi:MAG: ATP synthase F1 subunit delta [Saprospirales bacterium]|nr:MAG: ATP synthase F1 subunit delta [Saprospirales bacterium]